jgi:hypothetical protein
MVTRRMLPHQPVTLYVYYLAQHPPVINPRFASGLRKERPQPIDLRFGQPEQVAYVHSPLWEYELRRHRSIKHVDFHPELSRV